MFVTKEEMQKAMKETVTMKGKGTPILIKTLSKPSLLVTLECEYEIGDDEVIDQVRLHGKVVSYKRMGHTWAPEIENGKRQLKIIPKKDTILLPHFIYLEGKKHSLYYKGKGYFCKACDERKPYNHQQQCENQERYTKEVEEERSRQHDIRG